MKLTEEIEKLQSENEGCIVLMKSGIFFVGIGKDAVILNELLGLKTTCLKERVCKVGFPVRNVEKYIHLLNEKEVSFVIYLRDSKGALEELYRKEGKSVDEYRTCLDCKECLNVPEDEESILERVRKIGK